jgi:hypothetical protein
MRASLLLCCLLLSVGLSGQDTAKTRVLKVDGVNLFIKCLPVEEYVVLDEVKVTGTLRTAKYNSNLRGAAGYEKIQTGIKKFRDKKKSPEFDGVIVDQPDRIKIIKLKAGTLGAGPGITSAQGIAQIEEKTEKLVFYASLPLEDYTVISEVEYNQGGLGETMRGKNQLDVAINGLLDKGKRWVKNEKIDSDFDAVIIDWRALQQGKVKGALIRFL